MLIVLNNYIITYATIEVDNSYYPIKNLYHDKIQQVLSELDLKDILKIQGLGLLKVDTILTFLDHETMKINNGHIAKRYNIRCNKVRRLDLRSLRQYHKYLV